MEGKSEGFDFGGFETSEDFVKIVAGVPKVIRVENPVRQDQNLVETDSEGNPQTKIVPGLVLDVTEEDGVEVKKKLTVTSKRLVKQLKPLIESGRISQNTALKINIKKIGGGFDTNYEVSEV